MIMKMQRGLMASMHDHMVTAITAQSNHIATAVLAAIRAQGAGGANDQENAEDIVLPALVIPELEERAGNFGDRTGNSNPSYKVLKETIINIQREQDHKQESGSSSSGGGGPNRFLPILSTHFAGKGGGKGQERQTRCLTVAKKVL